MNPKNGRAAGMISKEIYEIVMANAETLDSAIIYNRDFNYNLYDLFPAHHPAILNGMQALALKLWNARIFSGSMDVSPSVPST